MSSPALDPGTQQIIAALTETPEPLPAAVRSEGAGGLPSTSGFYAWWVNAGSLPSVPAVRHPSDPEWLLLYVGIGPARASSRQTLRSRVIGNHVRGNVGSSTLRLSLASLLGEQLALAPMRRRTKVVLSAADNRALTDWQSKHLALTWTASQEPWIVEGEVIGAMAPALNLAGNSAHPFAATLSDARRAFKLAGES
jgi:hypothetical protein